MIKGMVVSVLVLCFAMISGCATYDDIDALKLAIDDLKKNVSTDMGAVKKGQMKQDDKIAALQKANAKAFKEQAQLNAQFKEDHASSQKAINNIKGALKDQAQLNAQFKEDHASSQKAINDIKGALEAQAKLNAQRHASSQEDIDSIKAILIEQAVLNDQFKAKHADSKKAIVSIEKFLEEQTVLNAQFKEEHANTRLMMRKVNTTIIDGVIKGLNESKVKMNDMMDDMNKK